MGLRLSFENENIREHTADWKVYKNFYLLYFFIPKYARKAVNGRFYAHKTGMHKNIKTGCFKNTR